jgi:hypothetical protein
MKIIKTSDTGNNLEKDNPRSALPKRIAEAGTILPSLRTDFLEARKKAPIRAPKPAAPIRKPYVCDPPCKTSFAKTGISTEYDIPIRLEILRRMRRCFIGANPNVYRRPSPNSLSILSSFL